MAGDAAAQGRPLRQRWHREGPLHRTDEGVEGCAAERLWYLGCVVLNYPFLGSSVEELVELRRLCAMCSEETRVYTPHSS